MICCCQSIKSLLKHRFISRSFLFARHFNMPSEKRESSSIVTVEENASKQVELSEDMLHHQQFIRNEAFFGEEGQKKIENGFITIVGLGGVGSHTAHMLARSGVGRFKFIDFDVVTVSSLNRHSVATRKDIGKAKVEVMRDHILEFNPTASIEVHNVLLSKENIDSLLKEDCDFIVDCIDDFTTKTDLLEYCIRNNRKVISSMGSGCRSNTTSLLITNITDVKYDPLGAKIRYQLKKRGINFDNDENIHSSTNSDIMKSQVVNSCNSIYIPCVSSYEKPVVKIMSMDASVNAHNSEDLVMSKASVGETVIPESSSSSSSSSMRYRCIPVYACVPAAFGNTICSYILHSLSQKVYKPSVVVPLSQDVLMKMYNRLLTKERTVFNNTEVLIDRFDILYLTQQVFKQKCVFTNHSIAGAKLEFTRWDLTKPPTLDNLILASAEECKKHEKEGLEGMDQKERARIQKIIDMNVSEEARNQCYY